MVSTTVTIEGLQAAQDRNLRRTAALQPGKAGRILTRATAELHRLSIAETPADTGSWRAGHHLDIEPSRGVVFIPPSARNSRTGTPVIQYAGEYEDQGGRYAVYKNVVAKHGQRVLMMAAESAALSVEQA